MKTKLAVTCLFFLLTAVAPAQAKVPEIPVPGLSDIAVTSVDATGQPVIYFNPELMRRSSPALVAYFFAHEYAHVELNHLQRKFFLSNPYNRDWMNIALETEADCAAAAKLAGGNPEANVAGIAFLESQTTQPSRPDYPTWSQRAATVRRCGNMPRPDDGCRASCDAAAAQCRSYLPTFADCLNDQQARCVDLCLTEDATYELCLGAICRADAPANQQGWRLNCQNRLQEALRNCETEAADCRAACD